MKWLTDDEVVAAARESDKAAILCSYRHWLQMRDATQADHTRAGDDDANSIMSDSCALCQRYEDAISEKHDCRKCPLGRSGNRCGDQDSVWHAVNKAEDGSDAEWRAACEKMLAALRRAYRLVTLSTFPRKKVEAPHVADMAQKETT